MRYSPVRHSLCCQRAFDLHVLGTPPAFVLSQDQTRHPCVYAPDLPVEALVKVHGLRDPAQVTLLLSCTWLFAENSVLASLTERENHSIDKNANALWSLLCSCSAFHSSIVKVVSWASFVRSSLISEHFAHVLAVEEVSHITSGLSRGLGGNFALACEIRSPRSLVSPSSCCERTKRSIGSWPEKKRTTKRGGFVCSRKEGISWRYHVTVVVPFIRQHHTLTGVQ